MSMNTYQTQIRGISNPENLIDPDKLTEFIEKHDLLYEYESDIDEIKNLINPEKAKIHSKFIIEEDDIDDLRTSNDDIKMFFDTLNEIFRKKTGISIEYFNLDENNRTYIGIPATFPWQLSEQEAKLENALQFDDALAEFYSDIFNKDDSTLEDKYIDDYVVEYYG